MPRSTESIMSELDARKIGYKTDTSNSELQALLDDAKAFERLNAAEAPPEAPPKDAETMPPVDYAGILCGLSTIQGLHRRICELEWKMRNA